MGLHSRSPYSVEYECPQCAKNTAANRRTGRLNRHHRPQIRDLCSASDALVLEPDEHYQPEPAARGANPNAEDHTCPRCQAKTKANRRTGLLYSHTEPGSAQLCPDSGRGVRTPEGGEAPQGIEPAEVSAPTSSSEVRPVQSSSSVRTVSGGLPTLGRRGRS